MNLLTPYSFGVLGQLKVRERSHGNLDDHKPMLVARANTFHEPCRAERLFILQVFKFLDIDAS